MIYSESTTYIDKNIITEKTTALKDSEVTGIEFDMDNNHDSKKSVFSSVISSSSVRTHSITDSSREKLLKNS